MSTAQLRVTHAGPLVSIQDHGRFGALRYGVSASGPMDRLAFETSRAALGSKAGKTGIEVSLGGVVLDCVTGAVTVAVAGGGAAISVDGRRVAGWQVIGLEAGQTISVSGGDWGSWSYISFAGNLVTNLWLEAAATHSMTGFGGGMLQASQIIQISEAKLLPTRHGAVEPAKFYYKTNDIRVTLGPQDRYFPETALQAFKANRFTVSPAYDRMGMRLNGPKLELDDALSIPSEPIMRGSIQVSGDGVPTVLLADHGTTGGYPKIATVIDEDQDRLAQLRSGEEVQFVPITAEEAVQIARTEASARTAYLDALSKPRVSLEERLLRENLVGGVVKGDES